MKRTVLFAIMSCCILLGIIVLHIAVKEEKNSQGDILPAQISFFFPEDENAVQYKLDTTFALTELPKEAEVVISRVVEGKEGILYHIKINLDVESPERYCYDWDRFDLGHFYVTDTAIYLIRHEEIGNVLDEEELKKIGMVVCQKTEKADPIKGQKGWHEWIEVQDNICEFHSYNDLVETGFYEAFIWEEGRGLIEYRSGFGAMRDHVGLERIH